MKIWIVFSLLLSGSLVPSLKEKSRTPTSDGPLNCTQLITKLFEKTNPKPGTLIKKYSKLSQWNPRSGWQSLLRHSPSLNLIDNFSSPATQQLIFSRKLSDRAKKDIISLRDSLTSESLPLTNNPPSYEVALIIKDIVERFRLLAEVLNATSLLKGGQPVLTKRQYVLELQKILMTSLEELQKNKNFIDDQSFSTLREFLLSDEFTYWATKKADNALTLRLDLSDLLPTFINSIPTGKPFQRVLEEANSYVENSLTDLPVGISYRPLDLTSTIRFGNRNFYGNLSMYKSTPRAAYERKAPLAGGLIEAELKVSNKKKKRMALTLDRSHQELDYFYGDQEPCGRFSYHSCGSYPPFFLFQHNVPVVSYAYFTPSHPLLSLAIQRILQLPHVKKFRVTHTGVSFFISVPIMFIGHDIFFGLAVEFFVYAIIIPPLLRNVVYLINEITDDIYEIKIDDQGNILSSPPI